MFIYSFFHPSFSFFKKVTDKREERKCERIKRNREREGEKGGKEKERREKLGEQSKEDYQAIKLDTVLKLTKRTTKMH